MIPLSPTEKERSSPASPAVDASPALDQGRRRLAADHHAFLDAVQQACGLDASATRRLVTATLETLGETLLPDETLQLSRHLPAELAPFVGAGPRAQRMETLSREEFLRRVMVRIDADEQQRCPVSDAIETVVDVTSQLTGVLLPTGPFNRYRTAGGRALATGPPTTGGRVAARAVTAGREDTR